MILEHFSWMDNTRALKSQKVEWSHSQRTVKRNNKKNKKNDWASNLCCDNWRIKQINCNAHQRLFTCKWIICIKLRFDKRKEEGYFHFYSNLQCLPIWATQYITPNCLTCIFFPPASKHLAFLHPVLPIQPFTFMCSSVFNILGQLPVEWWLGAWVLICAVPSPHPLIPTLCDSKLMPPLAPLSHTMVLKQRLV